MAFSFSLETFSSVNANSWWAPPRPSSPELCLVCFLAELNWTGLCCVRCTSPCSAGATWIGLLLCLRAQTFGHCMHPEGKLYFWKLRSILSAPGVSKIQSGNIPVMWNTRLTMRGWAGLTFQACYKFCGWNKEASKRKKEVMKECGESTDRDKNTFDNSKGWYTGKPKHSLPCM